MVLPPPLEPFASAVSNPANSRRMGGTRGTGFRCGLRLSYGATAGETETAPGIPDCGWTPSIPAGGGAFRYSTVGRRRAHFRHRANPSGFRPLGRRPAGYGSWYRECTLLNPRPPLLLDVSESARRAWEYRKPFSFFFSSPSSG